MVYWPGGSPTLYGSPRRQVMNCRQSRTGTIYGDGAPPRAARDPRWAGGRGAFEHGGAG